MNRIFNFRKWILPIIFVIVALSINVLTERRVDETINSDALFRMADTLTKGYRIKQIISATVLYIAGYLVAECMKKNTSIMSSVWALPIGTILWGVGSMTLLFVGIPYNQITAVVVFGVLAALVCRGRLHKLKEVDWRNLARVLLWCLGIAVIASSGVLPIFMSHDSYYFIMQYGEVIAKTGALSYDTAGAFMTWTGISSALMSSFATIFGYETITVIHWGLIISLAGCFGWAMHDCCDGLGKAKTIIAIGTTVLLVLMPSFLLLSSWVISNAYCMVLFFFLMVGIKAYSDEETKNMNFLLIISLLCVWLCLSRAEVSVCIAGLIVVSSMTGLGRKEMLILSVPMAVFQTAFLIRLMIQERLSDKSVYDTMITLPIATIMLVAVWSAVLFSTLIELKAIRWLRDRIPMLVILILPLLCLGIYFLDPDKFITGVDSIWYNLTHELWGTVPLLIAVLIVIYFVVSRKINYYIIFSYAYVFLNLALSLGRKHPLRYGLGDSCNRILISALPMVFLGLIGGICERGNEIERR